MGQSRRARQKARTSYIKFQNDEAHSGVFDEDEIQSTWETTIPNSESGLGPFEEDDIQLTWGTTIPNSESGLGPSEEGDFQSTWGTTIPNSESPLGSLPDRSPMRTNLPDCEERGPSASPANRSRRPCPTIHIEPSTASMLISVDAKLSERGTSAPPVISLRRSPLCVDLELSPVSSPDAIRRLPKSDKSLLLDLEPEFDLDPSVNSDPPSETNTLKLSTQRGLEVGHWFYSMTPQEIEIHDDKNHQLGRGKFGKVMLATRKTDGQNYAVKVLDSAETSLPLEIDVLVKADGCPYLIQFYGGFLRASPRGPEFGREVCMVLELMDLGSLSELKWRAHAVNKIPSEMLACITRQMLYGLNHLHKQGYIHRDIKPGNVLHNSRGHVKLTDFGLVLSRHKALNAPLEGTHKYMAPDSQQSFASDVWGIGMLVCELALLRYPYDIGETAVEVLINVLPEPRLPEIADHPKTLREFIELTLVKEVHLRARTESLLDNPFLWTPRSDPVNFKSWLANCLQWGSDSERWAGFARPLHRRSMASQ